jgi:DNA polymerase I/DNA polymerase-2
MEKNFLLLDLSYDVEDNTPVLLLFCKGENGKSVLVKYKGFLPYFYILPKAGKLERLKKKLKQLDLSKKGVKILKVEVVEKLWKNENVKLIKLTFDNPRKISAVRDAVKDWKETEDTFEYDISFYRKFLMDYQIEPMSWIKVKGEKSKDSEFDVDETIIAEKVKPLKIEKEVKLNILAFDTEFIEENGKSRLIMLSLVDNRGLKKVLTSYDWKGKPKFVESVKDEKEILERFIEIIKERNTDFILGYNSDRFDFIKLKEIASKNKVKLKLGRDDKELRIVRRGRISSFRANGRIHIDLYNFIEHILAATLKSEVLTLNEVAQELLGIGKMEMKYKEMVEIWETKDELNKLAEYNLWDSELVLKLSELILPQIFAISRLIGQIPFDASRFTYSQIVETFFMRKAVLDNVLIPHHPKQEEIMKRRLAPVYKGAIVIEPKKGIHSNILVFDFRSLYPTIIISHNIDPWTINCKHGKCRINKPPEVKNYFCTLVKGFIPKNLEEVIKKRKEIKQKLKKLKKESKEYVLLDNMQYALKIIANATYGYYGFIGARWYNRACGEATAAFGRMYISKVIDWAKKKGFEIIYGDTDSLMVRIPDEENVKRLIKSGEGFAAVTTKKLPGIIELEFRGLYEGGIFVTRQKGEVGAKKRYALIDYQGNIEIRGFETVRRDWCQLAKDIQRKVLVTILKEKNPKKALKIVRNTIRKIKERKVDLDDLIIYEQITRPLSQYKQIGPHVKAAMKLREMGFPVGEGMVIGFIITKGSGSISDRAMPAEFVKIKDFDTEYYIHNQILPASLRVLKALGYTKEDVITGKIQKELTRFLKS